MTLENFDWFPRQLDLGSSSDDTRATRDYRNEVTVAAVPNRKTATGETIDNSAVKEVTIRIRNYQGGLGRIYGTARQPSPYWPYSDLDRLLSSTNIASHERGVLSLATDPSQSESVIECYQNPVAYANIFGTHAIGVGKLANKALCKETSQSNPALTAITYSPGSNITYLAPIVIGGANQIERLAVCKDGGAVEVLSDLTTGGPTVYGTMNASTNPCWGIIASPLNTASPGTNYLLIYAQGGIQGLDGTAAVGAATTAINTAVPNGGYPVGICNLPGAPTRAYWVWPKYDRNTHSIFDSSQAAGFSTCYLASTQLDGTDPQVVQLPIRVLYAKKIRDDAIWVSDGYQVFEVSDKVRNLHWGEQRNEPGVSYKWQIDGLVEIDGIGHVVASLAGLAHFLERYVPATNSWHSLSTNPSTSSAAWPTTSDFPQTAQYFLGATNGMPYSPITRNVHLAAQAASSGSATPIYRQFIGFEGHSTYFDQNGGNAGVTHASSGSIISPLMLIEGLEGYPAVLEEIVFEGDTWAGGSGASAKITVGSHLPSASITDLPFSWSTGQLSATFSYGDNVQVESPDGTTGMNWARWPDNTEALGRFTYKVDLTRGTSTQTVNILPLQFKLLVFTDRKVRSPRDVRGF